MRLKPRAAGRDGCLGGFLRRVVKLARRYAAEGDGGQSSLSREVEARAVARGETLLRLVRNAREYSRLMGRTSHGRDDRADRMKHITRGQIESRRDLRAPGRLFSFVSAQNGYLMMPGVFAPTPNSQ